MRLSTGLFLWIFLKAACAEEAAPQQIKVHPLAQALVNNEAVSCASRANQLATYLSKGSDTLILQMPSHDPNKSLLMASLVVGEQGKNQLTTLSLAPNQAIGCGASYQTIDYDEQSCPNALKNHYPTNKAQAVANTGVLFVPLSNSSRVLAMTAGAGCLLIKQEIVE